ncbi:DUF2612 domain-containing protein [Alicyclobacillus macrosporangiidus]|uniref:Uncharacterized protein n=1 Tax=Alicyclobacillus macrosporangiidus TaxID=392015 RepID=A0A1I7IEC8_9BACL|nr:DUF2612 domain-containing protein [Alicyclobacillus macrosporangiidus]SFU71333.1 Protein of unknown function [Alicyclobacillus macrosporangiidus]
MAISKYLSLITSQHSSQPKFMAWLSAALQKVDDGMTMLSSMPSAFDLDTAVGAQLDVLGQIIGQPRNIGVPLTNSSSILDDEHYRMVLRAKIARNQWDGSIPQIYDIWDNAFPGTQLQLIDDQDMTMQAVITNLTDNMSVELVTAGLIIPKPMGVTLSIVANTVISEPVYSAALVTGWDVTTLTVPSS